MFSDCVSLQIQGYLPGVPPESCTNDLSGLALGQALISSADLIREAWFVRSIAPCLRWFDPRLKLVSTPLPVSPRVALVVVSLLVGRCASARCVCLRARVSSRACLVWIAMSFLMISGEDGEGRGGEGGRLKGGRDGSQSKRIQSNPRGNGSHVEKTKEKESIYVTILKVNEVNALAKRVGHWRPCNPNPNPTLQTPPHL